MAFYNMQLAAKEEFSYEGIEYEIVVYKADEDGHLRGYVSSGGFSDRVVDMSGLVASDMSNASVNDPVAELVNIMKKEIEMGKVVLS